MDASFLSGSSSTHEEYDSKANFLPCPTPSHSRSNWNGKILSKEKQKKMAGTIFSMMCNLQDPQIPRLNAELATTPETG
jgi:hypothetical protein